MNDEIHYTPDPLHHVSFAINLEVNGESHHAYGFRKIQINLSANNFIIVLTIFVFNLKLFNPLKLLGSNVEKT